MFIQDTYGSTAIRRKEGSNVMLSNLVENVRFGEEKSLTLRQLSL